MTSTTTAGPVRRLIFPGRIEMGIMDRHMREILAIQQAESHDNSTVVLRMFTDASLKPQPTFVQYIGQKQKVQLPPTAAIAVVWQSEHTETPTKGFSTDWAWESVSRELAMPVGFGSTEKETAYAELCAIELALKEIAPTELATTPRSGLHLFTDSKHALRRLLNPDANDALICSIIEAAWHIAARGIRIQFYWVPAHKGSRGNDLADWYAKSVTGVQPRGEKEENRYVEIWTWDRERAAGKRIAEEEKAEEERKKRERAAEAGEL